MGGHRDRRGSRWASALMAGAMLATAVGAVGATAGTAAAAACASPPASTPVAFSDVTAARGLVDPLLGMMAHAVAWGDVNRDGWSDVFVGSFGDRPATDYQQRGATGPAPDRLLLGGPTGFRVDATFPTITGRTSGAVIVDLDGDDWPEVVVGRNPRPTGTTAATAPSVVLPNDGTGRFGAPVTLSTTLGARSIAVLDVDGNRRPDLFVASDRWDGHPGSVLLRNDGGLRFSDVTAGVGLPTDVHALGAAAADLDGDGRLDLVTAGTNATGAGTYRTVRVFRGVPAAGGSTFVEVIDDDFLWTTRGADDEAAGVVAADLNRDGRLDLVVGQHWGSTLRYSGTGAAQTATATGVTAPVRLYLNTGTAADGTAGFREVTAESGLPALPTKSPDVQVADLDNDGWPDILTTASAADGSRPVVARSLGTDANGVPRFAAVTGLGSVQYWVQGPLADIDHDGRVEPLLGEWYARAPSILLHNDTPGGHWLGVAVTPLAAGYGARVSVYCAGGLGDVGALLGTATVSPASGYAAGVDPVARFGLGTVGTVDVRVELPDGRGTIDLRGVTADRILTATAPGSPTTPTTTPPTVAPTTPPTTVAPPRPPGPPTIRSVTRGSRRITVAVGAPADDGGRPVTGYQATCTSSNGGVTRSANATASPVVVTALTAGRTYRCTARARNVVGLGVASSRSAAVVPTA